MLACEARALAHAEQVKLSKVVSNQLKVSRTARRRSGRPEALDELDGQALDEELAQLEGGEAQVEAEALADAAPAAEALADAS